MAIRTIVHSTNILLENLLLNSNGKGIFSGEQNHFNAEFNSTLNIFPLDIQVVLSTVKTS